MRLTMILLAAMLLLIVDLSLFAGHYTNKLITATQQGFDKIAQH